MCYNIGCKFCWCSTGVVQLIRNQQVESSNLSTSSNKKRVAIRRPFSIGAGRGREDSWATATFILRESALFAFVSRHRQPVARVATRRVRPSGGESSPPAPTRKGRHSAALSCLVEVDSNSFATANVIARRFALFALKNTGFGSLFAAEQFHTFVGETCGLPWANTVRPYRELGDFSDKFALKNIGFGSLFTAKQFSHIRRGDLRSPVGWVISPLTVHAFGAPFLVWRSVENVALRWIIHTQ